MHSSANRSAAPVERRRLRRRFRRQRKALPPACQAAHAAAAASHFFASGLHWHCRTIGLYVANDGELDPAPLATRLFAARKRLALPVVHAGGHMRFHRYRRDTPLVKNRFGIPEPTPGTQRVGPLAIDVLLMPLVAFDARGTRLGMGAGFYDRFLGSVPARLRPRLVGLAHEAQRSPTPLPRASWDIPLDWVITEAGCYRFG